MQRDTAKGEKPELTSFVGASAAPSQTPAASPQITPMPCTDLKAVPGFVRDVALICFWEFLSSQDRAEMTLRRSPGREETAIGINEV
jgi:hypothetical protein